MDHATVEAWVEGYERAWRTAGTDGLADLFTPDVTYLPSPWATPVSGLTALAAWWVQPFVAAAPAGVVGPCSTSAARTGPRPATPWGSSFLYQRSSDDRQMDTLTRTYRFTITVNVEPGRPAYDDPEWAADAAWGTLVNEYGLRAIYTDVEEVEPALVL